MFVFVRKGFTKFILLITYLHNNLLHENYKYDHKNRGIHKLWDEKKESVGMVFEKLLPQDRPRWNRLMTVRPYLCISEGNVLRCRPGEKVGGSARWYSCEKKGNTQWAPTVCWATRRTHCRYNLILTAALANRYYRPYLLEEDMKDLQSHIV